MNCLEDPQGEKGGKKTKTFGQTLNKRNCVCSRTLQGRLCSSKFLRPVGGEQPDFHDKADAQE